MTNSLLRERLATAMAEAKSRLGRQEAGAQLEEFEIRSGLYALTRELVHVRRSEAEAMYAWIQPQPGEVCADVAAGSGFLTRLLEQWTHARVWAIDPSAAQLAACSQICGPRVVTVCSSADDPELMGAVGSESCDFVTSLGGIHHVTDQAALFRNVAALLKPGGRFVAADVGLGTPLQVHFDEHVARYCLTGHSATWLSKSRVAELASAAGLTVYNQQIQHLQWEFSSEEELALFFVGLHAYELPEHEIVAALRDSLGLEWRGGRLYLNWPLLFWDIRRPG